MNHLIVPGYNFIVAEKTLCIKLIALKEAEE